VQVVELLARRHGAKLKKSRRDRALVDEVRVDGRRLALAVPITYMNDSGQAVAPLAKKFEVTPEQLVIVHDELDLPPAALRVKVGGGLAGHNGLRSIKQHLHTDEFLRVRIGVGKPPSKQRGASHVLSPVSKRDREDMAVTIERAADAVEAILRDGVDAAMNTFNTATP
jgi:PTH1 family peptidyl-tRNA hydrolase